MASVFPNNLLLILLLLIFIDGNCLLLGFLNFRSAMSSFEDTLIISAICLSPKYGSSSALFIKPTTQPGVPSITCSLVKIWPLESMIVPEPWLHQPGLLVSGHNNFT